MGGLVGGGAPAAPIAPTTNSSEIADEATAERKRRQAALGRQSTIISSNVGTDAAANVQKSTLLG